MLPPRCTPLQCTPGTVHTVTMPTPNPARPSTAVNGILPRASYTRLHRALAVPRTSSPRLTQQRRVAKFRNISISRRLIIHKNVSYIEGQSGTYPSDHIIRVTPSVILVLDFVFSNMLFGDLLPPKSRKAASWHPKRLNNPTLTIRAIPKAIAMSRRFPTSSTATKGTRVPALDKLLQKSRLSTGVYDVLQSSCVLFCTGMICYYFS